MKIAPTTNFDECFQTFPRLRAPADLREFWQKAISDLKKIPVDAKQKMVLKKSLGWDSTVDVNFQSFGGYRLRGVLSQPRKRGKVAAVVVFPDYHEAAPEDRSFSEHGMAQLTLTLREHESWPPPAEDRNQQIEGVPPIDAFFQQYGLNYVERSYPYACFLDAIRAVDFMRLQKGVDASRIVVLGRGFGAAMAVFAAAQRPDIVGIALERMGFTWMEGFLQESSADYAHELRLLMGRSAASKTKARKHLELLDVLNWAEVIDRPLLATVDMKDPLNTPRPAFAFFNHLRTEKAMELFTENARVAPGEERKKSARFLAEVIKNL